MKNKIYSEETVNELFMVLARNTETGRCIGKLYEIYNELKVPAIKAAIVHDMTRFLSDWFKLVNDTRCIKDKTLLSKVLNAQFFDSNSYLKNIITECNRCGRSNRTINVVESYCKSCVKAVIMTSRRRYGFDKQGRFNN